MVTALLCLFCIVYLPIVPGSVFGLTIPPSTSQGAIQALPQVILKFLVSSLRLTHAAC